jgi:putative hydrolase of HD superfamily
VNAPDGFDAVAALVFEQGYLKRLPRAGRLVAGVAAPESRASLLATWHDSQETRTGDVPWVARAHVATAPPATVSQAQTAALPEPVRAFVLAAVAEYEAAATPEALAARDADKLDCLAQALEYRAQGNADTQDWIDTSLAGLATEAGRRLAAALMAQPPRTWWERARG